MRQPATFVLESLTPPSQHFHWDKRWATADDHHRVLLYRMVLDTGTFQHSSFLGGGLVSSAGLISVKQGVIHTLSPLSGHYR